MGKKNAPDEVFLVIKRFGRSGNYTEAAFTTREAALEHRRNRQELVSDLEIEFIVADIELLTHAPGYHDVYVIEHKVDNPNLAAMRSPVGAWRRRFFGFDIEYGDRKPSATPTVDVDDAAIVVSGADDERCWVAFKTAAEEHQIPYFGVNGSVNAPS